MGMTEADRDRPLFAADEASEDQLRPEQLQHRRRHRRRRRGPRALRKLRKRLAKVKWRYVGLVIIVSAIVITLSGLVLITEAVNGLEQSQDQLERVVSSLNSKPADEWTYSDFERLRSSSNSMLTSIQRARQRTRFLRPFSSLNGDLSASFTALEASEQLALAVDSMLTGLQPALIFLTGGQEETSVAQVSSGDEVVRRLNRGRGSFTAAERYLDQAANQLDQLDRATLSVDMLLRVEDLFDYEQQLREINGGLLEAPDLLTTALGLDDTRTYLILSQNSDELRPSGGYVSTYGWMTVRNGRIIEFDYGPSTSTSPSPPPLEMGTELDVPEWWVQYTEPVYMAWDASWYADFPSTARLAAWYYNNGNNPGNPVDGVIAIDIVGLEYMLEALGGIVVPDYGQVVDTENFRDMVYEIRATGSGSRPHKAFLASLYRSVLAEWQDVPSERKSDVLGAQLRAMREQHIMIYFSDESLNDAFAPFDWSGAQHPAVDNDYLMVVDANFSPNKSNRSIIRTVRYDVDIQDDGSLMSSATISYDYSGDLAENDPAVQPEHGRIDYYHNRLQVFVPHDATLLETDNLLYGAMAVEHETSSAFVSFLTVEYDTAERVQYVYETPSIVEELGDYRRYRLLLQKQPGTIGDLASVTVLLPPGTSMVNVDPQPEFSYVLDNRLNLEFSVALERDKWIEIMYR